MKTNWQVLAYFARRDVCRTHVALTTQAKDPDTARISFWLFSRWQRSAVSPGPAGMYNRPFLWCQTPARVKQRTARPDCFNLLINLLCNVSSYLSINVFLGTHVFVPSIIKANTGTFAAPTLAGIMALCWLPPRWCWKPSDLQRTLASDLNLDKSKGPKTTAVLQDQLNGKFATLCVLTAIYTLQQAV